MKIDTSIFRWTYFSVYPLKMIVRNNCRWSLDHKFTIVKTHISWTCIYQITHTQWSKPMLVIQVCFKTTFFQWEAFHETNDNSCFLCIYDPAQEIDPAWHFWKYLDRFAVDCLRNRLFTNKYKNLELHELLNHKIKVITLWPKFD